MMVQFVVQKKFTKQQSSSINISGNIRKKTTSYIRKIPIIYFWIFFGVFVAFYGGFLLLKYMFFLPEYNIVKIDYSLSSVKVYDDPYLYKTISNLVKGENINILSWNNNDIIKQVQINYPFVQDIIITYKAPRTVLVKIIFSPPDLIMKHNSKKFGVYKSRVFELFSGNLLGSTGVVNLDILSYSTGVFLSGVFFSQSADDLLDDIRLIKEGFPGISSLSYSPGGSRMFVHLGDTRVVYINSAIDINSQIINYQLLKKYYSDFALLKEIDLGSLEKDKVIVKK